MSGAELAATIWLVVLVTALVCFIAYRWRVDPHVTRMALRSLATGAAMGFALIVAVYLTITALSVLFLGLKL